MKNILQKSFQVFFLMCMTLVSVNSWGQTTLLSEQLRNGSLPSGWSQTSVTFTTSAGGYAQFTATGSILTTPVFDASAHTSVDVDMSVAKFGSGGDGPITVEYSLNGGTNWSNAGNSGTPTSATYVNNTVSISAVSATMRIRFTRASSASQKRFRDVVVKGIGSAAPSNVVPTATPTYSGNLNIGSTLTGLSGYSDADGDLEGVSTFKWYRADDASGAGEAAIGGATASTYTLTTADEGKYIRVGVVPVAATGVSPGVEAFSSRQQVNTRPTATLVSFSGVLNTTQTLTGTYTYGDVDGDVEGSSLLQWYQADDASGTGQTAIGGATSSTYVLQASDIGKFIAFGVTPVASSGSTPGMQVLSTFQGPVAVAGTPSLTVTEVLTEGNLNGYVATLTLVNDSFIDDTLLLSNFTLNNAPAGLTIDEIVYIDENNALMSFLYAGDFDTDITNFSITIAGAELASASPLTSNDLTITAFVESLVTSGTLAFGNQAVGSTSSSLSFSLSGSDLQEGIITVAAFNGFEYSINDIDFFSELEIVHGGGNLAATTIYVRFTPNALGSFNGNISISGIGASTTQAVSGTGILGTVTANNATTVTSSSFVANWDAVPGATSYEIDVYYTTTANATDLFFSEYGEGAPNNRKFIEIFNGTGSDVDLSEYKIYRATNGGGFPTDPLSTAIQSLTGTLANGDTYVIANNITDTPGADLYTGFANWNGDDALGLYKNEVLIDVFGTPNTDPGSGWTVAGTSNATVDRILVRKSTITSGNTNWTTSAGTTVENSEWIISRVWNASDSSTPVTLGSHTFNAESTTYHLLNENVGNVVSYEVTGLEPETEYFYVVRAIAGAEETVNSNEITVNTPAIITWNGLEWNNVVGPTINDDAVINGEYTTSGDLNAKSLTISATGSFTISTGHTLTLSGALINNATADEFVVQNNANFIQTTNATNSGDITVIRESAPIKRLDATMWSSPVTGQNLKDFSPATLDNRFLAYDSENTTYVIIDPLTTSMTPAQGYSVRAPNNWSATVASKFIGNFKGVPNNGPYDVTVSDAGSRFYLIGNPYPSSLSLNDLYNGGNNHIGSTFHLYEHTIGVGVVGNNFATYNVTGSIYLTADRITGSIPVQLGFDGNVKAGQGFFVEAAAGAGTITFENTMRNGTVNNFFFRTNNEIQNVNAESFKLNLMTPTTVSSQIALGFFEGATSDLEAFDSKSFASEPLFYSLLNSNKMAIQAKAWPMNAGEVFPLGFKAIETGEYTISLSDVTESFENSQLIFIHDQLTNTYHNLSEGEYTFISDAGTFDNRLIVVFTSILSNDQPTTTNTNVWVYKQGNEWTASVVGNTTIESVMVYDLQGRKLYEAKAINTVEHKMNNFAEANAIFIVQVVTADGKTHIIKTAN